MTSAGAAPAPIQSEPVHTWGSRTKFVPGWSVLFFCSGFPALLYQIVWQRALFTLYGVNIESVTVVVTAFMLGLGLGSLAGGAVSKRQELPLLAIFGLVELSIATYGILSLRIFHWAADYTAGVGALQTGLIAFALVLTPTLLMGSTLPILVSYAVRTSHNVGASVGLLYAVNTLGSATACVCAGLFLMRRLGEHGSVALAAAINAAVGLIALAWYLGSRKKSHADSRSRGDGSEHAFCNSPDLGEPAETASRNAPALQFNFAFALLIVGAAGFISLAYEMIWYRLFSYYSAGGAKSFAFLLGAYLAGIGIGSLVCQRVCKRTRDPRELVPLIVGCVLTANALGFLAGPLLSHVFYYVAHYEWSFAFVGVAAAFLGAVFPLTCHLTVPPDARAGSHMSYLYLSNIIGSALGSYLVGFVVMDVLPLKRIAVLLAFAGIGLAVAILLRAQLPGRDVAVGLTAALALALFVGLASGRLFDALYERMFFKENYPQGFHFDDVVENKSGIIATTEGIVLGGGIYDGRFNVDLVNDSNQIQRAYALSYFHPNPRKVLMIGLSSGSWAQVIANHPQVEDLTIVEINPGYLGLISKHAEVASLLQNPRVHIEIDDGRRWLVRNASRKFDAIVMNTSFHWRSHMTNLLSVEFLKLVQDHLKPGGVEFFNTTGSSDVQATALSVFSYGMRLANFMVVSESPLQLDAARWQQVLTSYAVNGKPVFDLSLPSHQARLQKVLFMADTMDLDSPKFFTLESAGHIRERTRQARIITDDNMGTEWLQ